MDARRYDRNADLIAQILFHTDKLHVKPDTIEADLKLEMVAALHRALMCNDNLGKMAEKGLI
tara:strand:+ start:171 stop:356 length:186 start_codon:yes stop_codon:yes gene_type:complete